MLATIDGSNTDGVEVEGDCNSMTGRSTTLLPAGVVRFSDY